MLLVRKGKTHIALVNLWVIWPPKREEVALNEVEEMNSIPATGEVRKMILLAAHNYPERLRVLPKWVLKRAVDPCHHGYALTRATVASPSAVTAVSLAMPSQMFRSSAERCCRPRRGLSSSSSSVWAVSFAVAGLLAVS